MRKLYEKLYLNSSVPPPVHKSEPRHCFLCKNSSRFTYSRASFFPDFLLVTYYCPGCHPKMIGIDRDCILNLLCFSVSDPNGRSGPYSSARELYD